MAQNDLLKRYLDAGMAFSAMTQARAEAIVRDLVRTGELQADQARDAAAELLERSRRNTDKLLETIGKEVRGQVSNLGLATKDDIARLERRIAGSGGAARAGAAGKATGKAGKKAAKRRTEKAAKRRTEKAAKRGTKKAAPRATKR